MEENILKKDIKTTRQVEEKLNGMERMGTREEVR